MLEGSWGPIPFKYPSKMWSQGIRSGELGGHEMGPAPPSCGWRTSGPHTDTHERRNVEEHHAIGKWCLLSTLKGFRTSSIKTAFVCLSSHIFGFKESRQNYFFFPYGAPNHNGGSFVWHLMNFIWTLGTPYITVLLFHKSSNRGHTPIRKLN